MKVELHTQEGVVGEVTVGGDGVCVGSNEVAARVLANQRIAEPGNPPTLVTPQDGERYLRALPINVAGTYFWATLVEAD